MKSNIDFENSVIDLVDDEHDYVSDFLNFHARRWPKGMNIFVSCGTGTGKTTFATRLSQITCGRTLILSNRVANLRQTRKKAYTWRDGIHLFGDCVISYQQLENNPRISVEWLNGFSHIVVDEAHYFLKDDSFNPKSNISLAKIIACNATKIFMSATIDKFESVYIQILASLNKFYFGSAIRYHMTKSKLYIQSIQEVKDKKLIFFLMQELTGKTLIFVDSKEYGRKLQKQLDPIFNKVALITSESKESEEIVEKKTFEELIQNEKFSADVLIATSVIDNGVNIIDRELKNIIICHDDKDEILQMIGRKRCIDEEDQVNIFLVSKSQKSLISRLDHIDEKLEIYFGAEKDLNFFRKPNMQFLANNEFGTSYRNFIYYLPEFDTICASRLGYYSLLDQKDNLQKLLDAESQFELKKKWICEAVHSVPKEESNSCQVSMLIKELANYIDSEITSKKELEEFKHCFSVSYWKLFGKDKEESHRNNRDLSLEKIRKALIKQTIPLELIKEDNSYLLKRKDV